MTGTSKRRRAAVGFRAHSGWACVVLAAANGSDIEIVDRRRIELCDPKIVGSKQPFHYAEPMPFAEAERFVAACATATDKLARLAIASLQRLADSKRLRLSVACVIAASGRRLPDLRGILASHALIHAAEGDFYRETLLRAAEEFGLPVNRLKEKDALVWTASLLGLKEIELQSRLNGIGKLLGPPWGADQKLATMAAWSSLTL